MVKAFGSVKIKLASGKLKLLTGVRYIPDMRRNLISLGALEGNGCRFKSVPGALVILKGSEVVMQGTKHNNLYYLNFQVVTGSLNVVAHPDITTWHRRLGHVSEKGLKELHKQGLIGDQQFETLDSCEQCILGKSKKASFPTSIHTTKEPLDYIHSDLWGPA